MKQTQDATDQPPGYGLRRLDCAFAEEKREKPRMGTDGERTLKGFSLSALSASSVVDSLSHDLALNDFVFSGGDHESRKSHELRKQTGTSGSPPRRGEGVGLMS